MSLRGWIGSSALFLSVAASGGSLAAWKQNTIEEANAAAASQPEPVEVVTSAIALERRHRRTSTSIGTVHALRSITLRNELSGSVSDVQLATGQIVERGTVLVALDVSVEQAELRALQAEAKLAESLLGRMQRAGESRGASEADVDRARAQRDVALASVQRLQAVIERKTIRAPFRARVGLSDVHPGQFLNEGTQLTTLQGVDDSVHVDFTVGQDVSSGLRVGDTVSVFGAPGTAEIEAAIVAIDSRVDPLTRNAMVRARIDGAERAPAPGAAVRVRVPNGEPLRAVVVPVSALRKGPGGDHVFILEDDPAGGVRARAQRVQSGAVLGDEVLIETGLDAGQRVAASGSFKLREGALVALAGEPDSGAHSPAETR